MLNSQWRAAKDTFTLPKITSKTTMKEEDVTSGPTALITKKTCEWDGEVARMIAACLFFLQGNPKILWHWWIFIQAGCVSANWRYLFQPICQYWDRCCGWVSEIVLCMRWILVGPTLYLKVLVLILPLLYLSWRGMVEQLTDRTNYLASQIWLQWHKSSQSVPEQPEAKS